ncbi:MAG: c-type cytochrome, partial [Planctomycetales bacterium]|nr:c-type cytochrome [Planctomycetales bacterium]
MSGLRQQKSWAAWLLPVMLPLICFGAAAAIMSIPPDTQGVDIVAGRDLFRANCGACHFAKMGFPAHHGPNLHEIGRTGAHRRPDMTAPEYILESILDPAAFVAPGSRPGMPLNVATQLTPEEVRNIVGFLASRDARPDYAHIRQLEIPDRRTDENESIHVGREQMDVAWRVLTEKGQCLECHTLYATPNDRIMAPALFSAGLTDRQYVRDS